MIRTIKKIQSGLERKIGLTVMRGVMTKVDTKEGLPRVIAEMINAKPRSAEYVLPYGFVAIPPEDDNNEVVMASMNGNTDNAVATTVFNRKFKPKKLKAGEGGIYDHQGQKVMLHKDEIVVTNGNGTTITISRTGGITIDAGGSNISITNCPTLSTDGDVIAGGVSLMHHKHGNSVEPN